MPRRVWSILFSLILLLPMVLGGCGRQPASVVEKVVKETVVVEGEPIVVTATPGTTVTKGGTIIYSDFSDAETLNPILFSDNASDMVCQMIFNALVQLDAQGNVLPDLAERWEVSSDEKTFTYYLRQDVKWQDGEPFTAADVKFTYDMILDEEVNSPRRADFVDLLDPANIVVLDDYTIQFTLNRIDAAWLCCKDIYMIIPEHILGDLAPADINTAAFNTAPVGTGPFAFEEWVKDDHIALVKNPDYFEGEPNADHWFYKVVENETVSFSQLQTGEADVSQVTAALWDQANDTESLDCTSFPRFAFLFYIYNLDPEVTPLFQDVRTRQALLYALDRQAMVDSIAFGLADVANSVVPPLSWAYNPDNEPVYPYDVAKAQALLDEAGWRDEDGDGVREAHGVVSVEDGTPFSFELRTNAGNQEREQAIVAMQQYWAQVGVEAKTATKEWNALLADLMETHQYEVVVIGFNWDVDPDESPMWHSKSYGDGFNIARYMNPDLDQILDAALQTTDVETRKAYYYQMQHILAEDVPAPIIYFRRGTECWNDKLHEYNVNDVNRWYNAHEWWMAE